MTVDAIATAWAPRLLSILRIISAFIFIQSGTVKLFAFPMAMPGGGTPREPHRLRYISKGSGGREPGLAMGVAF